MREEKAFGRSLVRFSVCALDFLVFGFLVGKPVSHI